MDSPRGGASAIIDRLPAPIALAVRRAGIRTNREIVETTCASLMLRRRIGPVTVRAVIETAAAEELRLACGCGRGVRGVRFCALARRRALDV